MTSEARPPDALGLVLEFTPRVEYVFEHTCGSQQFYLHRDGSVQCAGCKRYAGNKVWGERRPPPGAAA
jgi:hypothetical protein